MRACLFQMMDGCFSSQTSITSGSSGFNLHKNLISITEVSRKWRFISSLITWLPLSSFNLLQNALLLYLPCRGINRLSQNPLSPLSMLITCLIGWGTSIRFFVSVYLCVCQSYPGKRSFRCGLYPLGCSRLLPSELMNHVFMITSVGIFTATVVQSFVAVLFVIHLCLCHMA